LANLHNARRAGVPMVVVVGDHATYHKKYDAPLESTLTRWPAPYRDGCVALAPPIASGPMPPRLSPPALPTNRFRR